jgi:hypothetical protein
MDFEEKSQYNSQKGRHEKYTVFQIQLLDKSGTKTKIDESTNAKQMFDLATKIADRCGVPFAGGAERR